MEVNQEFFVQSRTYKATLINDIDRLRESSVFVDCTLTAEGKYLKAHRVILSASSLYFNNLFSEHRDKDMLFTFNDINFKILKKTVEYLYKGEVNVTNNQLGEFLKAAKALKIKGFFEKDTSEPPELEEYGRASNSVHDLPENSIAHFVSKTIFSRELVEIEDTRKRKRLEEWQHKGADAKRQEQLVPELKVPDGHVINVINDSRNLGNSTNVSSSLEQSNSGLLNASNISTQDYLLDNVVNEIQENSRQIYSSRDGTQQPQLKEPDLLEPDFLDNSMSQMSDIDVELLKFICEEPAENSTKLKPALEVKEKEHKIIADPETLKTSKCGNVSAQNDLKMHIFSCPQCKSSYTTYSSLKRHLKFYCGREYQCPICQKKIMYKHNLDIHLRTHNKSQLQRNSNGNRQVSKNEAQLKKEHKEKINSSQIEKKDDLELKCFESRVSCPRCSNTFKNRRSLSHHTAYVCGKKTCRCQHCGKVYKNILTLKGHIRNLYKREENFCVICKRRFKVKFSFIRHMKTHAKNGLQVSESLMLENNTKKSSATAKTWKSRNGKRNPFFECDICKAKYRYKQNLIRHFEKHDF